MAGGGSVPRYDVELIMNLLAENRPAREIAAIVGCSDRTVMRYKRAANLTRPLNEYSSKPISPERLAAVAELVAERYPLATISQLLHVRSTTVLRRFPDAAWTLQEVHEYNRMQAQLKKLPTTLDDIRRFRNEYRIAA